MVKLLAKYGYSLKKNGVLHQKTILNKWDSYTTDHFSSITEFNMETMNRYMYVVFQFWGVEAIMDEMINRIESMNESLRVSKFKL